MTQNVNQFGMSLEKGVLALSKENIFNAKINPGYVGTLTNASAVKLAPSVAGSDIIVNGATSNTDDVFGFIIYESAKNSYSAGDFVRIASTSSVMLMEAKTAVARGDSLEITNDNRVDLLSAGGVLIGTSLDDAAAGGDLIRVLIKTK
jgi:hypothetical protein